MNVKILLITILTMSFITNTEMQAQTMPLKKKILVAYFSWSGNTRNVAEQIETETGADIFEIIPATAYPEDYNQCVEQAKKEINTNYKPVLKTKLVNIDSYDIIIIGSPNWWGTIAPPVATFLSGYNFSGKIILPYITHEGSRMGKSESDIKNICPNATLLKGLPLRGTSIKNAKDELQKWLKDNIDNE